MVEATLVMHARKIGPSRGCGWSHSSFGAAIPRISFAPDVDVSSPLRRLNVRLTTRSYGLKLVPPTCVMS